MTNGHRREINQLTQILFNSILKEKYSSASLKFDELSILYMNEFVYYSELIDKKESLEEKREIHKELSSLLKEWKKIMDLSKEVWEKDKGESIHVAKINFQVAIWQKNFPLADEREGILSALYLEAMTFYSEHLCELEKRMIDTNNPFQKKQLKEKINRVRNAYTEMNTDWIDIQTARKLYSE